MIGRSRAPIVGIARQREPLAGNHLDDLVGAGADRDLQRLVLEMRGVGMGARQHRHHRQDQRQLAVVGAGEIEAHGQVVGRVGASDQGVGGALRRQALGLQQVEGEEDVGGDDLRAVGEMRRRIEMEDDPVARVVGLDRLGDEAVKGEGLVGRTRHQRLVDVADQALRRRQGLDVIGVEAVEGAEIGEREPAALGGVGVGVGQVVESGRQRRRAVHGDGAGRLLLAVRRAGKRNQGDENPEESHRRILGRRRRPVTARRARHRSSSSAAASEISVGLSLRMWKEVAGGANAGARPFMAAMTRHGTQRRAERGRVLLITDRKDDS